MTKAKALRSTTIIPDDLYVDRDADRQLEAIIDEMGRPGYVLVARQMGKTNLLLRMKRKREAIGDLVLYFDLSTRFASARDLFRQILDGFLERLDDRDLTERVIKERASSDYEPNVEYDRHIRWALAACGAARVIVILDEIDSLVGHDFSDRILSQIRSMYFARANYPEYGRLTYVLSGVAEPTDLIKDKNISPFNIGEKIYLSDFSLSEVFRLLRKAELTFSNGVVEAIYGWARGNPRMTWDICAALEDVERSGEVLSIDAVESVVRRLYLTRFDRPPIDHIRALAENDKQIRSSLISLLYGKGNTLDDNARSRLYLAGITEASANEVPKLKNRIIEEALSEAWLTQVEAGKDGLADTAAAHYRAGRYIKAVALYEQFMEEGGGGLESLGAIQLMELGVARYSLSRLSDAIPALQAAISASSRSRELRETLSFYLASAHLLSGDTATAIPMFQEVIAYDGQFRWQAKHALSSAYLSLSTVANADTIIRLSNEVLEGIAAVDFDESSAAELSAASHYNLAQVYFATNQRDKARAELQNAIASIDKRQLPGLGAAIIDLMDDKDAKRKLLIQAITAVLESEPELSESPDAFALKADSLGRLLDAALDTREAELFRRLLDFSKTILSGTLFDQILSLARSSATRPRNAKNLNALLRFVLTDQQCLETSTAATRFEAVRLWLSGSFEPDNSVAFTHFKAEIDDNSGLLEGDDIVFLVGRMGNLMRLHKYTEAFEVVDFIRSHEEFFRSNFYGFFVLFVQYEMALYRSLGDATKEREVALEIMRLTTVSNLRGLELPSHLEGLMPQIRKIAWNVLHEASTDPLAKLGRNDQVIVRIPSSGLEMTYKFKHVEKRLKSGELEFVRKK